MIVIQLVEMGVLPGAKSRLVIHVQGADLQEEMFAMKLVGMEYARPRYMTVIKPILLMEMAAARLARLRLAGNALDVPLPRLVPVPRFVRTVQQQVVKLVTMVILWVQMAVLCVQQMQAGHVSLIPSQLSFPLTATQALGPKSLTTGSKITKCS